MIRKIEEVLAQLQEVGIDQYGYEVLSLWGKEIIQECQNNFECTMEDNEPVEGDHFGIFSGKHPVLVRASIDVVRAQIK